MAKYRVIGTPVERVDGPEMLSGQALYGPDVKLPGMLWGKILRSPIPHGKVLRVDVEKATKHPGVKKVICAQDVPSRLYGYAIEDEHIFAIDKVHYVGQPVAAVAAIDEDTAEEALSLIDVEYDELPAVFDAEEAIRDGAPLVHDLDQLNARSVYLASWHPVKGTISSIRPPTSAVTWTRRYRKPTTCLKTLFVQAKSITVIWNLMPRSWPSAAARLRSGPAPKKSSNYGRSWPLFSGYPKAKCG